MNWLLVKILNAPAFFRKLVAFALAAVFFALCISVLLLPYLYLTQQQIQIVEKRKELGTFERQLDRFNAALPTAPASNGQQLFLSGSDEGLLQADLQSRLNSIAQTNQVDISSIGPSPSFEKDEVRYVGVTTVFVGRNANLQNVLMEIESTVPRLLIQKFRMSSLRQQSFDPPETETGIRAELTVYGAIDPEAEEQTDG